MRWGIIVTRRTRGIRNQESGSEPCSEKALRAPQARALLAKERIDIAIAIGTTPPASTLVRQHLADWENVIVGAQTYLRARGVPKVAADLAEHDFVALPHWHHAADVLTGPAGERYR